MLTFNGLYSICVDITPLLSVLLAPFIVYFGRDGLLDTNWAPTALVVS